jgi:branched-chain amino acid transport system substrate-binding protein
MTINMTGNIKKASVAATAMVAAAVMALAGCGSGSSSGSGSSDSGSFVLGGLFPETGSLAFLGPAEVTAWKLAAQDINAAGGITPGFLRRLVGAC